MRIISGTFRGRRLAAFSGKEVRPTPDRVREALFSMLTSRFGSFTGIRVLELFCGSGAQTLEALSRGAHSAVMIDSGQVAVKTAQDNIHRCGCADQVQLIQQDVYLALPRLAAVRAPFDLILLDPPYHADHVNRILKKTETLNLLDKNGIICCETAGDEDLDDFPAYQLIDDRTYGTSRIRLYRHAED